MLTYEEQYPLYEGLIKSLVKQYSNQKNFDDMKQAASVGFLMALNTYNPRFKASLATWVYIQIRKQLQLMKNQEHLTTCSPKTREKLKKEVSVPICDITLIVKETPYDILLNKDRPSEIMFVVSSLSKKLTKKEISIFTDYYMKSKSITYIKNKYKIENLDNMLEKFKRLLKQAREKVL